MYLTLHDCTSISIPYTYTTIKNMITLKITCSQGRGIKLVLYGLPSDVTDRLIVAFGPPKAELTDK
jgi:hypothetical protein